MILADGSAASGCRTRRHDTGLIQVRGPRAARAQTFAIPTTRSHPKLPAAPEPAMKHVTIRILCVIALVTAAIAMVGIASTRSDAGAVQVDAPFSMMTPF